MRMFGVDILLFEPGCPEPYPEPYPERSRRGAEGASKGILVHFLFLVYLVGERSRTPHPIHPGSNPRWS